MRLVVCRPGSANLLSLVVEAMSTQGVASKPKCPQGTIETAIVAKRGGVGRGNDQPLLAEFAKSEKDLTSQESPRS
jgi:hypothetical protein